MRTESVTVHKRPAKRLSNVLLGMASATAMLGTSTAALAQIDEIVITATKRETSLLETPLAVAAFSGEDLEDIGANNLGDFLQFAPGVTFQNVGNGRNDIFIRNIGGQGDTAGGGTFTQAPIGYYIDEVPFTSLGRSPLPDIRAWDLERVEVLRGPQGTLYGASSLGGTIRILTNDPVHNELQAKGDFFGSLTKDGGENYGAKMALNVPLIDDKLSLRVAGTQEEYSGWIDRILDLSAFPAVLDDDELNEFDTATVRGKLRFTPTKNVDLVLTYAHTESRAIGSNVANDAGEALESQLAVAVDEFNTNLYAADLTVDFEGFTLESATSYYLWAQDNTTRGFIALVDSNVNIFNQEIRLVSSDDQRFDWVLGGIYSKNDTDQMTVFDIPALLFTTSTVAERESQAFAVYGEGTYAVTDTFDMTFGLRFFEDQQELVENGFTTIFFVTTPLDPPRKNSKFNDLSPKFNFAWKPVDNQLYYATVSKGFRSGTLQTQGNIDSALANAGVVLPESIDEEVAWNFEAGTKLQLFDERLTLDLTGYHIRYSNIQNLLIFSFAPLTAGLVNSGSIHATGFEFATALRISESLNATVSGNYNQTEFQETDALGLFTAGDQVLNTPKYTVAGALDFNQPIFGGNWSLVGRTSVEVVGKRTGVVTAFPTFAPFTPVPGDPLVGETSVRVNLRAGIQHENVGFHFFAENVNNDDSRQVGSPVGTARGVNFSRYRPRTVGINVKLNY